MNPILAFDIETVPDVRAIRLLNDLPDHVSDADAAELAFQQRRAKTGSDFMQHHLHRIVAISCCLRWNDKIHIGSIGSETSSEAEIIAEFFKLMDKRKPQLVSWNGGGFDLPVLHYRALIHGIQAACYWEMGERPEMRDWKFNNYISRYHTRHCDLMDLLSLYQARAAVPLDDMAKLCGFPGKLGTDGSQVWHSYQQGDIAGIRHYCETDAANTYLVFQRFRMMTGALTADEYEAEIEKLHEYLSGLSETKPHWAEFLDAWV